MSVKYADCLRGRCIGSFLLAVLFLSSHAQSVRILSTRDGLPQSFISGLLQDKEGFIWIGTRNGLARYDGIQYKTYSHNVNDSNSVASNVISRMWMGRNNTMWISYEAGELDAMDPVTEKVTHFITREIKEKLATGYFKRGWLIDSAGIFWGIVKGAGLTGFDKNKMSIRRYTRSNNSLPGDTLRGIMEDKKGRLWVLGQQFISFRERGGDKFTNIDLPFHQDFNNYYDSDEEVVALHERGDGRLMWGDRRQLVFFDPEMHNFKTIPLDHYPTFGIRWIESGLDNFEYFESNGDVYRYDDFNGLSKVASIGLFAKEDARSFLADRSGVLWVGTNAAGIHQLDLVTPFFKSFGYERDYPGPLLKQEFGLSFRDVFNWDEVDNKFSPPGYHFRSLYDRNKVLWMALKATVCYSLPGYRNFVKLPPVPIANQSPLNKIVIKAFTLSPAGTPVVVGFDGSVYQYDMVQKSWKDYLGPRFLRERFGPSVLPQDVVADDEYLWITTELDGFMYINVRTKEVRQLKAGNTPGSLPTNQLLGCIQDPAKPDFLWIGSHQGLIHFDKRTLQCQLYGPESGLPDNTIYSIQIDAAGELWLSTNKGLCRFNPQTHKVRVFRSSYGLPGDEFNRFHHVKLPDGRLSFAGTEGWTIFDPMALKDDNYEPRVSLTSLKINNMQMEPAAANSTIHAPINSLEKLVLSYADNTISVGFAGLQFNQPQDILYRYRLKGYDDSWIGIGHTNMANYTRIPPGHYTLMVNASNTTGIWSNYIKTIEIIIRPPWWCTWWAYVCYAIAGLGLTWAFIQFRIKRGILKQEVNTRESEANHLKELDELKTRFFSNITHEFRTPLTLILGPAEQLKDNYQHDARQKKLTETIIRNANQLLLLVNQLMDLAKLEAKALTPVESVGKPADIVQAVVRSFESDAHEKNIGLVFDHRDVNQEYLFSAEVLERIVYNLLSNSLKFTGDNGKIQVVLTGREKGIGLVVKDNGIGIPRKKLPNIFDRFYQAHDKSAAEGARRVGTGIGLSLVKELVELQGGKISVQSYSGEDGEVDTGTTFTIQLPYRPAERTAIPAEEADVQAPGIDAGETEEDKRPRILLAEDSAELADFVKDALSDDYLVYHVVNGAQALDNALKIMPDLVISDVLMPVMDGFALTSALKHDIRTSHIPVILLTAKASQESRIEGLTAGANDYLNKPFHPTELKLRIRNLLDQQSRLREHARQQQLLPIVPKTQQAAAPVQEDPFLVKIYELIDESLDDPLFGVEELVQKMDMSRTSLHRRIKSVTGMSAGEVIRNHRLKRASVFLLEGNNGTDTAYMSGFGSPAYFTKCFREVFGITPGEFVRRSQS